MPIDFSKVGCELSRVTGMCSTLADPAHQLAHVNLGSRQVHVNLAHELLSLKLIVLGPI